MTHSLGIVLSSEWTHCNTVQPRLEPWRAFFRDEMPIRQRRPDPMARPLARTLTSCSRT
jgi:hypothetical protein